MQANERIINLSHVKHCRFVLLDYLVLRTRSMRAELITREIFPGKSRVSRDLMVFNRAEVGTNEIIPARSKLVLVEQGRRELNREML